VDTKPCDGRHYLLAFVAFTALPVAAVTVGLRADDGRMGEYTRVFSWLGLPGAPPPGPQPPLPPKQCKAFRVFSSTPFPPACVCTRAATLCGAVPATTPLVWDIPAEQRSALRAFYLRQVCQTVELGWISTFAPEQRLCIFSCTRANALLRHRRLWQTGTAGR